MLIPVTPEEILKQIEAELGVCQKCQTRQRLCDVQIRKKQFGGKFEAKNLTKLCMPCDEEWREHCEGNGLSGSSVFEDFENTFETFLTAPKPKISGKEKALAILEEFTTLRVQIAMEAQRHEGRFRSRSKRLDELYPLSESYTYKLFKKKGYDDEAEISEEDFVDEEGEPKKSWKKFLMSQVAEVTALKRALDREIERQLVYFPIWDLFAKKIPGIGPYLVGFLIAAIRDPKRFPDSSSLSGNAGLRIIKDEQGRAIAQPKTRDKKLDYDPLLKLVVVRLIPMCLDKQKNRADSPYSDLTKKIEIKEKTKAENAMPTCCWIKNCQEKEVVNLGYEERVNEKTGETKKVFLGFCCKKTQGKPKAHKFLNPNHVLSRVYRDLGRKFLADFYHAWLYLEGENPDVTRNPRIMHFLRQESTD